MKNKAIPQLTPELRFPEFRNAPAWEAKPLSKLAQLITKKAGDEQHTLFSIDTGKGLIPQIEKFGREIAGKSYKNYLVIKKGDFAYNKSSTKQHPEGEIALFEAEKTGAVPSSIFTCFSVDVAQAIPKFLKCHFENNIHGKWLRKFITVGARAHGALNVNNDDLLKLPITLSSLEEQQKIADCLSSLDDLIMAETQKLEALQERKKGLLQNLFPAEGETLPKFRFPEFRDNRKWEVKKLGEVTSVESSSLAQNKLEILENGYPVYGASGFIGNISSFEQNEDYIAIVKDGSGVGSLFFYEKKSSILGTLNYIKAKNKSFYSLTWIYYLLQTINFSEYVKGSGIPHIYFSDYSHKNISLPSVQEQQKIADCLSSLDDLITAETQNLETLQEHKTGLMQKLFPSNNEKI